MATTLGASKKANFMSHTSSSDLRKTATIATLKAPVAVSGTAVPAKISAPSVPAATAKNSKSKRSRDTENDTLVETKQKSIRGAKKNDVRSKASVVVAAAAPEQVEEEEDLSDIFGSTVRSTGSTGSFVSIASSTSTTSSNASNNDPADGASSTGSKSPASSIGAGSSSSSSGMDEIGGGSSSSSTMATTFAGLEGAGGGGGGTADDILSATSSLNGMSFDAKKALANLDLQKYLPQAKKLTGEEKYPSAPAELRAYVMKKHMKVLALQDLVLQCDGKTTQFFADKEKAQKIMAFASKQAVDVASGYTQMATLTRDNSKLKQEVTELKARLADLPINTAISTETAVAAATSLYASKSAAELNALRISLEATIARKDEELMGREALLEALKEAHAQEISAVKEAHQKQRDADSLRANAETVRGASAAATKARNETQQEADAKFSKAKAEWDAMYEDLQARLTTVNAAYNKTSKELDALRVAKATAEQEAEEALNAETTRAEAAEQQASVYRDKFEACDAKRLKLLDEVMTLKGNIRVFVRVRPALSGEIDAADDAEANIGAGGASKTGGFSFAEDPLLQFPDASSDCSNIRVCEKPGAGRGGYGTATEGKKSDFNFQRVFPPTSSQAEVFEEVEGLVQSALDGHRVCIFAYGQTGSGKTHTMEGRGTNAEDKGLIPRSVEYIFTRAALLQEAGWTVTITAEMLEIYNDKIRDLLSSTTNSAALDLKHNPKDDVVSVPGLSQFTVEESGRVYDLLSKASSHRATAATSSNATSSRSHSVFTLRISAKHGATSQSRSGVLNLIDLAGSERLAKSGAQGDTLKETQAINSSLSHLGQVIRALHERRTHVPYRDSKLTHILYNSLGKDCKTLVMCNLNPLHSNAHESLCTLRFAQDVAKVSK